MSKLSKLRAWCSRQRIFRTATVPVSLVMLAMLRASFPMTEAAQIVLTDQHPTASSVIDVRGIARDASILEIEVTDVSNPGLVPIGVAVSLAADNVTVPVGSFAFYPADHGGRFHLDAGPAMARVGRRDNLRLLFELKKLRPSAVWKPVRVSVAPPRWMVAKGR
jgi:hypothetical protein